jgi:CHAD domain-containing protein
MTDGGLRAVEIELKYRVADEAAGEGYLHAETIGTFAAATPVRTRQIEDRYVDTAEGDIARAGFAVRLRRSGSTTTVGVKSLARQAGPTSAHRREELEGPAHGTAGPLEWPASDARSLVLELAGDASLIELVTVRQLRRRRELRDGTTRVELSLDDVDVLARSEVIGRFIELEAELLKGDEGRLSTLDEVFAADPALEPAATSKLETALATLRGETAPAPSRAARTTRSARSRSGQGEAGAAAARNGAGAAVAARVEPVPSSSDEVVETADSSPADAGGLPVTKAAGVVADDHLAEAARKVLRFHLARMLAREAGTREGTDPRDLHAMRVATRRQRAAWRVFGESFRPRRTKRYRNGLREIAARLGAVRDLDVLLEAADAYRSDLPRTEQRGLEPLLAGWRQHRDDARVLLMRELDSDGYRRWVDDYRDFVRTEGAAVVPVAPVQPHHVRDTAASRIWEAYEQVRGYEPVLRWADVETLHELRIAGKWLRYTIEFVREALGDDAAPIIAKVTTLQDHLGLMNDADVAARMARTFLVEHAGELSALESAAIGRYLVSREREVARLRRTVGTPWRGVAGIGFRRSLGRVVARL